jgi:hypothetical protein
MSIKCFMAVDFDTARELTDNRIPKHFGSVIVYHDMVVRRAVSERDQDLGGTIGFKNVYIRLINKKPELDCSVVVGNA